MITYKQLTLAEVFENCQNKFDNDKYHTYKIRVNVEKSINHFKDSFCIANLFRNYLIICYHSEPSRFPIKSVNHACFDVTH